MLNFGQAIEAVKKGELVAREGWNGKGMFIFQRPFDNIDISIIPNIKSLPNKVKDYFVKNYAHGTTHYESGSPIQVHFKEYLCMVDPLGNVINGWLASQTDLLEEDWIILE